MTDLSVSLIVIPLLAVLAPVLAAALGSVVKIPVVVFEIVLGILIGPSLLDWVNPTEFIDTLANLGLAMLFFMAGNEINFAAIKGRPLKRASLGWLISLGAGVVVGILFAPTPTAGVFIGVALCSTALGTILPMLRDAQELETPFGRAVTAIGAAGEFGPLIAISLFLSGRNPGPSTLVLILFAVITAAAIWLASRGSHQGLHRLVAATLHTTGQFAVRFVILIMALLAALSIALGLDMLLGAFAAGVLWRVLVATAEPRAREVIEMKLDAVAFGFLVPVFFINTGIAFNLTALISNPATLALVPLFLVLFLVIRGLPGLLASPPGATKADKRAIVLFSATGLPIIVAVTQIGVDHGQLDTSIAAALVGAGMLSVLLFPLIALGHRKRSSEILSRPTHGPSSGR
ncbi:cation:proton antiporter [Leifsonia sp. A12D58]|uniref:cation:proton antiporter n=1 Tax=Leifsonia sp. A12D58 TaxID=3397674 RepID=UPI0039E1ABFB